ncbi:MAG: hypothetical protein HFF18_00380 [Oscillospiraceae bacterium]|nr:hypothetical protein [Oscillospiraceae bacterium]
MAGSIISTITMFTSEWVTLLALFLCAVVFVLSQKELRERIWKKICFWDGPKKMRTSSDPKLKQLMELKRAGLLSDEEYEEKRQELQRR